LANLAERTGWERHIKSEPGGKEKNMRRIEAPPPGEKRYNEARAGTCERMVFEVIPRSY
jgi:hypothetical protein